MSNWEIFWVLLKLVAIVNLLTSRSVVLVQFHRLLFWMFHFMLKAICSFCVCVWGFCCITKIFESILKILSVLVFIIILHIENRLLEFWNRLNIFRHFDSICPFSIYFVISNFSFRFISLISMMMFLCCTYEIDKNYKMIDSVFRIKII